MKFIIEKTKQEAEQDLIKSKAQVERQTLEAAAVNERDLARAKAEAQQAMVRPGRRRLQADHGKATAEYQQAVAAHLSDQVLKLEKIKATAYALRAFDRHCPGVRPY